jgi:hypothetical protein
MAGWLPEVVTHVRAARNVRIDQRTAPSGTLDAQHAIEPADVEEPRFGCRSVERLLDLGDCSRDLRRRELTREPDA